MRIRPFLAAAGAAFFLASCAGDRPPESLAFAPQGASPGRFEADRAACLGEAAKADMASPPMPLDADPIAADIDDARRERRVDQVMVGCMAAKGYRTAQTAISGGGT